MQQTANDLGNVLIQVQVQLLEQAVSQQIYPRVGNLIGRIEQSIAKLEASLNPSPGDGAMDPTSQAAAKTVKLLGTYLIEAELLTPFQVQIALADQQRTGMRFGDILVSRGWIKRGTIEYIMEKIILPERSLQTADTRWSEPGKALQFPAPQDLRSQDLFYKKEINDRDTFIS